MPSATLSTKPKLPYRIRSSPTHGRGAFATRTLRKGMKIIEYVGTRSTWDEASARPDSDADDPYHTMLFETSDGTIIDAALKGNAARFINHSCAPNCQAFEYENGRVYIHAKRTIQKGEELTYDYKLSVDGRITKRAREAMACRCGAARCRGTMLALPKKKKKSST
jgi:SET domain-containing protein